jgi:hypothetical protein
MLSKAFVEAVGACCVYAFSIYLCWVVAGVFPLPYEFRLVVISTTAIIGIPALGYGIWKRWESHYGINVCGASALPLAIRLLVLSLLGSGMLLGGVYLFWTGELLSSLVLVFGSAALMWWGLSRFGRPLVRSLTPVRQGRALRLNRRVLALVCVAVLCAQAGLTGAFVLLGNPEAATLSAMMIVPEILMVVQLRGLLKGRNSSGGVTSTEQ